MEYTQKLDKKISKLCFGGAGISGEGRGYGFGGIGENQAIDLLLESFHSGINIFDFAPIYGFNLAEMRAGLAFKDLREKVLLVSKCGVDWHDNGRVNMSNDPKIAQKMLDRTLKNFNSDYVDIYLVHWPDPKVDIRHTMEALFGAKEKGKIKHLGLCNTTKEELALAKQVAPIEVIQSEFNLWHRENFSKLEEQLEDCMLTMGWGTFDKGILAGSVDKGRAFESDDCRSWAPWWKKSDWKKRAAFTQKTMQKMSLDRVQMGHHALGFSSTGVDCSLSGMKSSKHLKSNLTWMKEIPEKLAEVSDEFTLY